MINDGIAPAGDSGSGFIIPSGGGYVVVCTSSMYLVMQMYFSPSGQSRDSEPCIYLQYTQGGTHVCDDCFLASCIYYYYYYLVAITTIFVPGRGYY